MKALFSNRHFFASVVSVFVSVFMVAVVAYGSSTMDTASVGAGTSTPGMAVSAKGGGLFEGAVGGQFFYSTSSSYSWLLGGLGIGTTTPGLKLGVKGAGLFEGPVGGDFFYSTSSDVSWLMGGQLGLGTTTPGTKLGVRGGILADDFVYMSSYTATSTTATSTTKFGMTIASTSVIDGYSGRWGIGTTTVTDADVLATTLALDPSLTISGVGSAANATGTLYVAGAGNSGGQIIIKSSDGSFCVSLIATAGGTAGAKTFAYGASATDLATVLFAKVVACPR